MFKGALSIHKRRPRCRIVIVTGTWLEQRHLPFPEVDAAFSVWEEVVFLQ